MMSASNSSGGGPPTPHNPNHRLHAILDEVRSALHGSDEENGGLTSASPASAAKAGGDFDAAGEDYAEREQQGDDHGDGYGEGVGGAMVEIPFADEDDEDAVRGDPSTHAASTSFEPGDRLGKAASRAHRALRRELGNDVSTEEVSQLLRRCHVHPKTDDASNGCCCGGGSTSMSRQESRATVRLLHRICMANAASTTPSALAAAADLTDSHHPATSSAVTSWSSNPVPALLPIGTDASMPWYVREECFRCLRSDLTPSRVYFGRQDWNAIIATVEGKEDATNATDTDAINAAAGAAARNDGSVAGAASRPSSVPPAQVRSAALSVITSHRHSAALSRLAAITESADTTLSELDSKAPIPGWYDGTRQLQLARAVLGDVACYVSVVGRCYDPSRREREEAREALDMIGKSLAAGAAAAGGGGGAVGASSAGMTEIARRIALEDELLDERGEVPDYLSGGGWFGAGGGHSISSSGGSNADEEEVERVWEFLRDKHWNQCIIRWASEQLKKTGAG